MLKIAKLTVALAAIGLAAPAFAQWPKGPSKRVTAPAAATAAAATPSLANDGFTYAGAEESGYQLGQYRYFRTEEKERAGVWRQAFPAAKVTSPTVAGGSVGGFRYGGEGIGWEPTQHKYVWAGSRLAHSDECDHVVRAASAITPADIEAARKLWPAG